MRQGRHSRRKDDWGTEPSRSTERSAAITAEERDPAKRSPGRKDKDYCKPGHGPHVLALVVQLPHPSSSPCGWTDAFNPREKTWWPAWRCVHHEVCEACGKHFRHLSGTDCPDWREITETEEQDIADRMERWTARLAERYRRKPVVTGPQGYRRAKPAR